MNSRQYYISMKIILNSLLTLSVLLCSLCQVHSQEKREFLDRIFISQTGQTLPYKIIYPDNFKPSESYPVLLFLHGAGERGTDNDKQVAHGRNRFMTDDALRDVIFLAPQCPVEDYWVNVVRTTNLNEHLNRKFPYQSPISSSLLAAKELLDAMISLGFVDVDRIYGAGISMGAMGILDMAMRYPDLFAAVQPICGGVNVDRTKEFNGKTAFRFFHGLKDDIVLPKFAQENCAALKATGVEAVIIEYPYANHNSWDPAFAEDDFFTWLLNHRKTDNYHKNNVQ